MFNHSIATAIDYNRGLPLPIMWLHAMWAAARPVLDVLFGWMWWPRCRNWAPLLAFTLVAIAILWPQDASISESARAWLKNTGGDIKRELEAIQQFGQGLSIILIALTIALIDPANRRRLADWGVGALVALATTNGLKVLVGRPRPGFGDADSIVGPLGAYATEEAGKAGQAASIKLATVWNSGYDLASMPSKHAAFAVLAAAFLSSVYPRLWPVAFATAIMVCIGRVVTGAHYPTDVIAGVAIGLLVARYAVGMQWGQRLIGRWMR